MSLNNISSTQVPTGTNVYANALLNGGWRWDTSTITGDASNVRWSIGAGLWSTNEIQFIRDAVNAWGAVAKIDFQEWTGGTNGAEIVLHKSTMALIGGFGGYSGTPGEALAPTDVPNVSAGNPPWTPVNIHVGDLGQVHTRFAMNAPIFSGTNWGAGTNTFWIIMHEIGHALGLKHPHDRGANGIDPFPGVTLGSETDLGNNNLNQKLYTIMSYNDVTAANGGGFAGTPMAFDIAAIQQIYGANVDRDDVSTNSGNNTYTLLDTVVPRTMFWSCIWDMDGTDQIVYNGSRNAIIDLRPATLDDTPTGGGLRSVTYVVDANGVRQLAPGGFTIAGDLTNALDDSGAETGVVIENASGGSGNDTITGNKANNTLRGNGGRDTLFGEAGDDTLSGGSGADRMMGGAGNDVYVANDLGDTVSETMLSSVPGTIPVFDAGGTDTVKTNLQQYRLENNIFSFVENLTFTGSGTFHGIGNGVANVITGGLRVDKLEGAAGDDTLNGFGSDDSLYGGGNNDWLNGGGGADTMRGNSGNDTYIVDNAGDRVIEFNAFGGDTGGVDTVLTSRKLYDLDANVENLTMTALSGISIGNGNSLANVIRGSLGVLTAPRYDFSGLAGNDTIQGGFNALGDTLDGGTGNDELKGLAGKDLLRGGIGADMLNGGLGADTLMGGTGDDRLFVDNSDVVNGGADFDFVFADASTIAPGFHFTVAGTQIEHVSGNAGNDRIDATGFATTVTLVGQGGNDTLTGGSGDDVLYGFDGADSINGGAGFDQMIGGNGDDTITGGGGPANAPFGDWLFGDSGNDRLSGSGFGRLFGGTGNDTMTGGANELMSGDADDDVITGGAGLQQILGGTGNDTITGGAGTDFFDFADGWGSDQITDFENGIDTIRMTDVTGLDAFGQLSISTGANGAIIAFAGNNIVLVGFNSANLDAADFTL